jgi:hypothetical protein
VIECCPPTSVEVVSVATPLAFSVPTPIVVAPSENVTVPPGATVDPLGPATVAVNVTPLAATAGFGVDVSSVVVGCLTLSVSAADVAAAFWLSPAYTAVIVCGPVASVAVEIAAVPVALRVAVPI